MIRSRSSFPLVVGVLTVVLALAVAYALTHRAPPTAAPAASSASQVSDAAYETQMKGILLTFDGKYAAAPTDIARLVLVEDTLSQVLSVRVPEDQKAFHLEIAVSLNQWRDGLRGDKPELAAARTRYAAAEASVTWLK